MLSCNLLRNIFRYFIVTTSENTILVPFVEDNATMSSIRYFEIMYRILCKTEGSRPYQTHFSTTNKCFDSTQIYN